MQAGDLWQGENFRLFLWEIVTAPVVYLQVRSRYHACPVGS